MSEKEGMLNDEERGGEVGNENLSIKGEPSDGKNTPPEDRCSRHIE